MKHFKTTKKGMYQDESFKRQRTIQMLRKMKEERKRTKTEMRNYENSDNL